MSEAPSAPRLTVAIATRNRPDGLLRAVESLRRLAPEPIEVLVIDDASDEPIEPRVREQLGADFPFPVRVIRHATNTGYIPGRNEMAREAKAPFFLSLDDDAELVDDGVLRALAVIESDPAVGAVALGQVGADGQPHPLPMQPAPEDFPCQVASFRGFGHILRRDLFLKLGGYRELFWFYGEETEFCKRLLDAGSRVVYLPEVRVAHLFSLVGRNQLNRYRYGLRNACYDAILNEPLPMPLASLPVRFYRYARHSKVATEAHGFSDRGSLRWVAGQVLRDLPRLLRMRRGLRWSTYSAWKRLNRARTPYAVPAASPAASVGG